MSQFDSLSVTNNPVVKLGFIPLIDCAPFVIAQEKGFFLEQGVNVQLNKEASWASIRDKVAFNLLDGAHMLASMPLAASLGLGTVRSAMQTSFTVSHNGNGITVGKNLFARMQACASDTDELRSGKALKRVIEQNDKRTLRFAIVYPYSSHNYLLRDWLDLAGINPDRDVQIIVVPPTQMMTYLQQGEIDGYCVGEPWNSLAVEQGIGQMLVTGYDVWGNTPEKVFGVNQKWAEQNPAVHQQVIRALDQACCWVQDLDNRNELLSILSDSEYLNCTVDQLRYGFSDVKPKGGYDWPIGANHVFSGPMTNYPSANYALWIVSQMWRWQQLARPVEIVALINNVYRQDVYCLALGQTADHFPCVMDSTNFNELVWLDAVTNGQIVIHKDGIVSGIFIKE
ncbi:CmpA/NrtA family ABC transporter substrate-binding protein [Reinekea sp.]|jgi:ABC-type nitrate/sulfonate/bicarbonate transport system substrate-binding protein|uniref:CmpA/NrtA family ABC transporter substrate-binding protein n=1 Tax=Reinekea sp. TaxID=1970455 RepID=UPI003989C385